MLPLTTKEEILFTPEGQTAEKPLTYVLAVPTTAGRIAWQKSMTEAGLRYPSDEEIKEMEEEALTTCFPKAKQAALLDVLEKFSADPEAAPAELKEAMVKLEDALASRHIPLKRLLQMRVEYWNVSTLMAAKFFLRRVENGPELKFIGGKVSDDSFAQLDENHLALAGIKAVNHARLSKESEKN